METDIVTILNNEGATWAVEDLQAVPFAFSTPFKLSLADGQLLYVEEIIRVMPKRRLVVLGTWAEKPVVAKLFFDAKHAERHCEKDVAGVRALRENKIPAPALYHKSTTQDGLVHVLLFERIFHATSLGEAWRNRVTMKEVMPLLRAAVIEIATQHVLGVVQHDLHLNNFLLTRKTIYTLDGGQIEAHPPLLPKKKSMKSLALFLSQLGVGVDECQEKLFKHYAKSRGWLPKAADLSTIFHHIKKWNEKRWLRFEKKIFRSSTDFSHFSDWYTTGVYDRHYAFPEFTHFLMDPESAFSHPSVQVLKEGRSSTVIKVTLDKREFVVKRNNIKSFWHGLRRCFRPTRAMKSWRLAHKLVLFGVSVANPVAFIEKRFLGLRGKSYYVSEYISSTHVGDYLQQHAGNPEKVDAMIKRVSSLLKNLTKLDITHGDLKMTNILIDQREHPVLIDLDGATEHTVLSAFTYTWRQEMQRFLRNFDNTPEIAEKFKMAIF